MINITYQLFCKKAVADFFTDLDPALRGKVYVRIPETDWDDMRFTAGIELV